MYKQKKYWVWNCCQGSFKFFQNNYLSQVGAGNMTFRNIDITSLSYSQRNTPSFPLIFKTISHSIITQSIFCCTPVSHYNNIFLTVLQEMWQGKHIFRIFRQLHWEKCCCFVLRLCWWFLVFSSEIEINRSRQRAQKNTTSHDLCFLWETSWIFPEA